jgi:hypothetical protein
MALNSTRGRTGHTLRAVLIMRTKIVFISGQPIKVYLLDSRTVGFQAAPRVANEKAGTRRQLKNIPSGYLPVATSSD